MEERPIFWYYPHYSGGLGGRPSAAIREGQYKLVHFFESDQSELYHLETDRAEESDLSNSSPKRRKQLNKKLQQWVKEMAVQLPYPNPSYQPEN